MEYDVKAELSRVQQQFLIHSFLYYKLDTSIIPDTQYDRMCEYMNHLMETNPLIAKQSPYDGLCKPCRDTGSGFYIKEYPLNIITIAMQMLYHHQGRHGRKVGSYPEFLSTYGYK